MSNRQATNSKIPQKKGNNRKNNSSNRKQARANGGPTRANGNGQPERAPVSSARQQSTRNPEIKMSKDGTHCFVKQRELIDIISSSSASFSVVKRLRVNPGSSLTFPWLSTIALSFETFRFRKLHFTLIARCPTTTSGSALMSPDYDAQDGPPVTETQMSQMKGCQEGAPWQDITLKLDPAAMNRLFKAHVNMDDARFDSTNQDEKTIDPAQVFVGLDMDVIQKVSKLWVDYEVELFTPQPPVIAPDRDGATLTVDASSLNPTVSGGLYSNSVAATTVRQSDSHPLFEVIDNSITPSGNLVRMLRDWQGNVDWKYNTTTSNAFGGLPNLYKNGILIPRGGPTTGDQYQDVYNGLSGTTATPTQTYTSTRSVVDMVLKVGDILGINPAGLGLANPASGVDTFLRFGGNSHPLAL